MAFDHSSCRPGASEAEVLAGGVLECLDDYQLAEGTVRVSSPAHEA